MRGRRRATWRYFFLISFMPHFGQVLGLISMTSGCIGQVYCSAAGELAGDEAGVGEGVESAQDGRVSKAVASVSFRIVFMV
jgi:hypothetical protein